MDNVISIFKLVWVRGRLTELFGRDFRRPFFFNGPLTDPTPMGHSGPFSSEIVLII